MTVTLRNTSGQPLSTLAGRDVGTDEVIVAQGVLVEELDDAYVIGVKPPKVPELGDNPRPAAVEAHAAAEAAYDDAVATHRAYPKSHWTLDGAAVATTPEETA